MSGPRIVAWVLFTVWAVWLLALQSLAASAPRIAAWVPDLGLVFALVVAARAEPRDAPKLALAAALARGALAVDPFVAILAGMAGALLFAVAVRSVVPTTRATSRFLVTGAAVCGFHVWLVAVHAARSPSLDAFSPESALVAALPAAFTSAVVALFFGPVLERLPGITPLRRRTW